MWSVTHLYRCTHSLRGVHSKLISGTGSSIKTTNVLSRHMVTPIRCNNKLNSFKGFKISNIIKSNGVLVRFCANAPKTKPPKAVGYWLLGCSGMVFAAVVLGGVTRLTESGLSMVTWRLLGERLPTSEEEWHQEFLNYQQYPEYKYKNQSISLSEFKWIWYMEFAHRSWGRAIGAAVFLPAAYFWARGLLDGPLKLRVAAYCLLVGAQGLMGWYMVKSGLEDRFEGPSDVPRVSQYRLAAHLSLAFLLYSGLLAGALRVLRPFPAGTYTRLKELKSITALAHTVKAMVFLTAVSGAFVAGLDAGLVYNSFPKMGDRWVPDDVMTLQPAARNFTENPAAVQLQHRALGTATLLAASALWARRRALPLAPPVARRLLHALGAMAWLQVSLGIMTLVQYVPTPLGASHQAGSLALLSLAVWLTHEIKLLKFIPK